MPLNLLTSYPDKDAALKKALAVALLLVFLFNMGGYYLFFIALKAKSEHALAVRLDRDAYTGAETLNVKIPLTLPYPIYTDTFERSFGTFEYRGEYYKLIKHKFTADTLTVVLIKNQEVKKIAGVFEEFASRAQQNSTTPEKAMLSISKLLGDFENLDFYGLQNTKGWCQEISQSFTSLLYTEPSPTKTIIPPDFS